MKKLQKFFIYSFTFKSNGAIMKLQTKKEVMNIATYEEYTQKKNAWLAEHPEATPKEIEEYSKALAKKLNL